MLHSEETLAEKFVKKWFWLYLFTIFIAPLGYITKVIISRDLSIEEVGMLYGVISFLLLLSSYNDLGCTESLNYFLPKNIVKWEYGKAKYLLWLTIKIQILSSILIILMIFLLIPWLTAHYFKSDVWDLLTIGLLFFLGINLVHIASTIFSVSQDTKLWKSVELVRLGSSTIGTSILFFTDFWDTRTYMMSWILGLFLGCIFWWYYAYNKYYRTYFQGVSIEKDTSLRKSFYIYSFGTLLTANISILLSQIDMQLIIYFLDQKSVWYYSTYLSLISLPFLIIGPIAWFLFPVISELSGRGDIQKIRMIVREFSIYFMIIGIWTGLFLFEYGEYISVLLFWEKFRESWYILQYSSLFIIFNFLIQISFQVMAGTWKIKERAHILFITLLINIPLTIFLISTSLWVRWAALAVGISWIPLWYMSMRVIDEYREPLDTKQLLVNLSTALLTAWSLFCIEKIFHISWIWIFCIAIFAYLSIFLLVNKILLKKAFHTIQMVRKGKNTLPLHIPENIS